MAHRLSETAMLVSLNITIWNSEREDKKAGDAVAAKYGSDGKYGKYRKFLVDPDSLKPITKLRGEARTKHYELTLPWDDNGGRIISAAGYMGYRDEMRVFQSRMDTLANEFAAGYSDLVYDARQALNGLYNPSEYPANESIRGKFSLKWNILPVPEASDFRVEVGEGERRVIQAKIQESVTSQLEIAMQDVARRIREVVGNLSVKLKAYQCDEAGVKNPFRDSLVGNVRTLCDILPSLNLTGDTRIAEITDTMKRELTRSDADSLRVSDTTRDKVAVSADSILRKMSGMGL